MRYFVDENGVVHFARDRMDRPSRQPIKSGKAKKLKGALRQILRSEQLQLCPACQLPVKGLALLAHMRQTHRYAEQDALEVLRPLIATASAVAIRSSGPAASHAGSQTRDSQALSRHPGQGDGQDAGLNMGQFAREGGKFGSLPKYDDYGDESSPQ
jgi:hypothetical protein